MHRGKWLKLFSSWCVEKLDWVSAWHIFCDLNFYAGCVVHWVHNVVLAMWMKTHINHFLLFRMVFDYLNSDINFELSSKHSIYILWNAAVASSGIVEAGNLYLHVFTFNCSNNSSISPSLSPLPFLTRIFVSVSSLVQREPFPRRILPSLLLPHLRYTCEAFSGVSSRCFLPLRVGFVVRGWFRLEYMVAFATLYMCTRI